METTHATPLAALLAYARQKPRLEFGNYGERSSYESEARRIRGDLTRAERAALELQAAHATDADIIEAARGGRLTIEGAPGAYSVDYCTGQYWPTEYRPAVARVLESARSYALQRAAAQNPPARPYWVGLREIPMSEIRQLNDEIGSHWFDKGSMRFFGTRVISKTARVSADGSRAYFVTSDQPPHGRRAYSVRYVLISGKDAGHVSTSGEFCAYSDGREASAALRADLATYNANLAPGA